MLSVLLTTPLPPHAAAATARRRQPLPCPLQLGGTAAALQLLRCLELFVGLVASADVVGIVASQGQLAAGKVATQADLQREQLVGRGGAEM